MLNAILVIIGIAIFGYSIYLLVRFLSLVKKTSLGKWWIILFILILFFALGYIVFAYWLMGGIEIIGIDLLKNLVSFVFFFGAIFVVITVSLIYSTVKNLTKEKKEIQQLQKEKIIILQNKEAELEKRIFEKTEELEKMKSNLEEMVKNQTVSLQEKLTELEQINKLMVGRELKMEEMKKEIEELKKRLGEA